MPPTPHNLEAQLDELVAEAAAQTAAVDPEEDPREMSGPESIDELDDLLSDRADEALMGAFETVDQVLCETEPEAHRNTPDTPDPAGIPDTPAKPEAAAAVEDDDPDADANFQTLDEALDEMTGVPPAPQPAEPPDPPPPELPESPERLESASAPRAASTLAPEVSEAAAQVDEAYPEEDPAASAADVAAALDAEESAAADFDAPVPPVIAESKPTQAGDADAASGAAPISAAAPMPAPGAAAKPAARAPRKPGPLTHALAMTWAPGWLRDVAGFLGIQTLLLAACLFTYIAAGRDVALITAAATLPLLTLFFYVTFIRRRPV